MESEFCLFDQANRRIDAVFSADQSPRSLCRRYNGWTLSLGQRRQKARGCQFFQRNRGRASAQSADSASPKRLVGGMRDDNVRDSSAQTGGCRPGSAMMDDGFTAREQPRVGNRLEGENIF